MKMNESDKIKYVDGKSSISHRNYKTTIILTITFFFFGQLLVGLNKSYGPVYIKLPQNKTFSTTICKEELTINYSPYTRDVSLIICGGYFFTFFAQLTRLNVSVFSDNTGLYMHNYKQFKLKMLGLSVVTMPR